MTMLVVTLGLLGAVLLALGLRRSRRTRWRGRSADGGDFSGWGGDGGDAGCGGDGGGDGGGCGGD